jgi:signal transduction histidine kinase
MKIKLSIQLYIFVILTSFSLLISTLFSLHSAQKFLDGFNSVVSSLMQEIGNEFDDKTDRERYVLGYHATNNWQQVPKIIKEKFLMPPKKQGILYKQFVGKSFLFPPEKSFELMLTTNKSGQLIYISKYREREERFVNSTGINRLRYSPLFEIIILAVMIVLIFIGLLLYVFKKTSEPVEALYSWAKALKIIDIGQQIPNFKFKELQLLAQVIHSNVKSVNDSIEREQAFLNFASHELRTPITILRSNSILLDKISPNSTSQEKEIRDRIQRASTTMKNLTETLLWLSSDNIQNIKEESFDIKEVLIDTVADCDYLLKGKEITVTLNTESFIVRLPLAVTQIVLTNLINNAFQHSYDSQVFITQSKTSIEILNREKNNESVNSSNDISGFGLGLKLVQKLTKKFNWYYHSDKITKGYIVKIDFVKSKSISL